DWGLNSGAVVGRRQFGAPAARYAALGIDRSDRAARTESMLRNWMFCDAPHAIFFAMDKSNGMRGAVDLGIYAQSLALLMAESGIATCFQGALNQHPEPVRGILHIPE